MMKITNRIAGKWKLFSNEMPPEVEDVEILTYITGGCVVAWLWIDGGWWADDPELSSTDKLAEIYDAFCVIKGPWEEGAGDE